MRLADGRTAGDHVMIGQPSVLVTGAGGFIGGHVSRMLAAEGFQVRALVRRLDSPAALVLAASGATMCEGDVRDPDRVKAAMAGAAAVVHTAMPTRLSRRESLWSTAVDGSACVAQVARACAVLRVVHVSSYAVYYGVLGRRCDEDALLPRCGDLYADAKLAAERALSKAHGAVVLRAPLVYGPGSWHWTERPFRVARHRRLWLPDGGDFPVACVHVTSFARAVLCAVAGTAPAGVYNVFDAIVPYKLLMQPVADEAGHGTRSVPARVVAAGAHVLEAGLRAVGAWAPVSRLGFEFLLEGFKHGPNRPERAMTLLGWQPEGTVANGVVRREESQTCKTF